MKQYTLRTASLFAILFASIIMPEALPSYAKAIDSSPSDSSFFTTVINLPPDPNIGDNQNIGDSTQLNVSEGGIVGREFEALSGSEVNISGGTVSGFFSARAGSQVNISGGFVNCCFFAWSDSEVNISGGTVDGIFAFDDSAINISGGVISTGMEVFDGSIVNISGGTVVSFSARLGSTVNLLGTQFLLDGVLLNTLTLGETHTITDRDSTLSGLFTDGSAFSYELNSIYISGKGSVSPGATVTVTLVPEPGAVVLVLLAILGVSYWRVC